MKIVATRATALAAGAWTTLSFTLFDIWERSHYMSEQVGRVVYFAAALILWAAPAILFVIGFDRKRWNPNYVYEPGAQADYSAIGMRTLFWFVGSIVCSFALRLVI